MAAQIRQVYPDFYEIYYEIDLKGKGSCTCTGWAIRGKCRHVDQAREYEGQQAYTHAGSPQSLKYVEEQLSSSLDKENR